MQINEDPINVRRFWRYYRDEQQVATIEWESEHIDEYHWEIFFIDATNNAVKDEGCCSSWQEAVDEITSALNGE